MIRVCIGGAIELGNEMVKRKLRLSIGFGRANHRRYICYYFTLAAKQTVILDRKVGSQLV
ncbi:hypothetical protein GCM10019993_01400 [Enterococcus pseudoavium]